ncbi:hypothetical protein AB0958_18780 [Streptomyces sp. NPDC006655]|uniref:hypothetical protein n=1 Tax=Streptomyces sp. NPDC006655 TaxID=3156898 RepID=UPI003456AFE6
MAKAALRTFLVTIYEGPHTQPQGKLVEAAYYLPEDGCITFKDADGQAVYTVQSAYVFSVERVSDTSLTAEVRRLMKEADTAGLTPPRGTITNRAVAADGHVTETTYAVTVEAVQVSAGDPPDITHEVTVDTTNITRAFQSASAAFRSGRAAR